MDYQQGFRDGFIAGMAQSSMAVSSPPTQAPAIEGTPVRKPSAYNRRYARAYRRIKRSKTLKNGNMSKGYTGRRGHERIVKMAHAEAKKGGRK